MPAHFRALGIDLSLNHAGLVQLNEEGEICKWNYITNQKSKPVGGKGILIDLPVTPSDESFDMERLRWWQRALGTLARPDLHSEYVGIEGYAFAAPGHAHATAELGGIARLQMLKNGSGLRLHDPLSVKMFATGRGNATAEEVCKGVFSSWGVKFDFMPRIRRKAGQTVLEEEDLCAAYTVARMVWTEVMLREGELSVDSLPAHQARVFKRVTKANPKSILERDFVYLKREAP